jgi:SAM-dependent methyltransferase
MDTYSPGKKVLDIGAGLGGSCRMIHAEYGSEPIGLEYLAPNIELGNEISRELKMPEFLTFFDAYQPSDIRDGDCAFMFCVLAALDRPSHMIALKNVYEMIKPGGYLYIEDAAMKKLEVDFGKKRSCFTEN